MTYGAARWLGICGAALLALAHCGDDEQNAGPSAEQCQSWSDQANEGRRQAQDGAARACVTDAECVLVNYELPCALDCGYLSAVAASALVTLEPQVDSINGQFCGSYLREGCPTPIAPPCDPPPSKPPVARCQGGTCVVVQTAPEVSSQPEEPEAAE